jgi:hypothetical protein
MNDEELRDNLKKFIGTINSNRIKLIKLSSNSNENLSGMLPEVAFKRKVEIALKSIGTGEQGDSDLIVFGHYLVKIEDTVDETPLVSFEAEYRVILSMESDGDYKGDLTEEQQKVIGLYFSQSGKIILFPYVRHLYDMIVRESDLFLPPLRPILFKS